jgi:hypothetical protein
MLIVLVVLSLTASADEFRYRPDDSVLATLAEEQSLDLLRQMLGSKPMTPGLATEVGAAPRSFYLDERGRTLSNKSVYIDRVEVLDDRIRLRLSSGGMSEFAFRDLAEIESFNQSPGFLNYGARGVTLSGGKVLLISERNSNEEEAQVAFLRRLAEALHVLKRSSEGVSPEQDRQFAEVAARYRTSMEKPPFPEEARRYRVQAESAVRDKRLADAVRLYQSALKVVPWWPEGRFNRSLVLAELSRYAEAMAEMKRYLALVPDAPNARAAQDKIYEWEGRMLGAGAISASP